MPSISNVLELSLGCALDPQMEAQRRADIEALRQPLRRKGALVLHNLAIHHPDVAKSVFNASLKSKGLVYLGSGAEASAYSSEGTVIKVRHNSFAISEAERQAVANAKNQEFEQLERHMGAFVVPQQVIVSEHPFAAPNRVIQTIQPYVNFRSLNVVVPNQPQVQSSKLAAAESRHPGIASALSDFVEAADLYYGQTGYLPDINGKDNLVIANQSGSRELVLVDSQPIPPSIPWTQELIASQLDSLGEALARVA